uniref:Putative salivary kunitz domain protein n=1 Tax=Ixodes ricinus TaxID=34613 RepID=A0A0K8R653_IXORI
MQLLCAVALVVLACIVVETARKERPKMPRICRLPPGEGRCRALLTVYSYNKTRRRCQKLEERGCPGEGNGFWSMEDCQRTCEDNRRRSRPKIKN